MKPRASGLSIDALALALRPRPRPMFEAADLGIRLLQEHHRSLLRCWLPVVAAIMLPALALVPFGHWLPSLAIVLAKPWLDRTVLFVLARAAFGQTSTFGDLWQAQRPVWWRQFWRAWTVERVLPWRAFVAPVHQLEGLAGPARHERSVVLARGRRGVAAAALLACCHLETALVFGLIALMFWLAPPESGESLMSFLLSEHGSAAALVMGIVYACAVAIVEPFYVATGFGMYLNRRVELEAWDLEQELRSAFAAA